MFEGVNNIIDAPSFETAGNWQFSSSKSGRDTGSFDAYHGSYVAYVQSARSTYDPSTSTWGPWESGWIRYPVSETNSAIDWTPREGDQLRIEVYAKPAAIVAGADSTLQVSFGGTTIYTFTRDMTAPAENDGWLHFMTIVEGTDSGQILRFDSIPGSYDSLANQTWLIDAVIVEYLTNPAHDFSGRALRWEKGWYQCDICGTVVPYSYTTRDVLAIEQKGYRVCIDCLDTPGSEDYAEDHAEALRRAAKTEYRPKPP
jgi:hypothetical protein